MKSSVFKALLWCVCLPLKVRQSEKYSYNGKEKRPKKGANSKMKLLRRITAIILTALMLAVTSVSVSAANLADYYDEATVDELMKSVQKVDDGVAYGGYFEQKYDKYWFRIDCKTAGTLTLNIKADTSDWNVDLYDKNGDNIKGV